MSRRQSRILWALALVLILAQMVVAVVFTKGNTTALTALADAAAVRAGSGFILNSPVMSLWGVLCRVSGISVWTFATKVLPVIIIPLCYGAYILLVKRIDKDRAPMILIFISLLQVYGYQSEAFAPYTLLLGWFTGKSILVHLIGPLAAYGLIRLREVLPKKTEQTEQSDDLEDTEMKNKYFNVRNISIAIVILAIGVAGALFILNRKINNVYAATVNLQKSIEEKGDFIEFTGADGEEVKGYLLVGNQGVTVIFGGSRKDGEALYELIGKYGGQVDSWYLRRDEENGAYDYCCDQMLKIRHVYKIQGIDEVRN